MKGVENVGAPKGYFDNLIMYCGMVFDVKADVKPLCSNGANDSLFVWNEETMNELKRRGANLQRLQLDAVAYLWELCYDLLLAEKDNVTISPGFEAFGLRVNRKKWKRDDDVYVP